MQMRGWLVAATIVGSCLILAGQAHATVGFNVHSFVTPSEFSPNDELSCVQFTRCDRHQVVVRNMGDTHTEGAITLTDTLPAGITTTGEEEKEQKVRGAGWKCSSPEEAEEKVHEVVCRFPFELAPGETAPALVIPTTAPSASAPAIVHGECLAKGKVEPEGNCSETNEIEVSGGGTSTPSTVTDRTVVSSEPQPFDLSGASFETDTTEGMADTSAGGHPNGVSAGFELTSIFQPVEVEAQTEPVQNPRDVIFELPAGFVGDPLATPVTCPETELIGRFFGPETVKTRCPLASRVGVVSLNLEGSMGGQKASSGEEEGPSSVYNMTPQSGYPAEFAFVDDERVVFMYPTLVHTPTGYRLRVSAPGIVAALAVIGGTFTFFGDPALENGTAGPHTAFLTNPADCSAGPLTTKIEADSWEDPGRWVSREVTTYPQITNCNVLQFEPKLQMAPSPSGNEGTSQADEPSAYDFNLEVPQKSLFEEAATPDLKDATVTLPEGVAISPATADGVGVCQEHGLNGIDIPVSHNGHEAGEGETIGPDGLPHMIPGHCPSASTLGTVEIETPLLPAPVRGHVYLAAPKCGGGGQLACTEASATNGELYGLYIEAEDRAAGVIVKIPGTVSADPVTGRLTGRFTENPQLPVSSVKIHFHGGPGGRAPLANPQSCGSFATSSTLTSWAGQQLASASPPFAIDWDGKGGACPPALPFQPSLAARTVNSSAGAFSPLELSFSRNDREQNFGSVSVTTPTGLGAIVAGVPRCGEAQANAGMCPTASQIGTARALAGSGPHPFAVNGGRVYLTEGYKGKPFGLSIVVPAVAGPFNLGNVVVRTSLAVDPVTAAVTATSDPLPQSRDGVPFRLRTVDVTVDRPGFVYNPTSCAAKQVTGTVGGAPVKSGEPPASVAVASPFAVTGCTGLPFAPSFAASTEGSAGPKGNGASLAVRIAQKTGEANIHQVIVTLPKALPARLTTLQKACTEAQFAANPAGCPEASNIGTATAVTPVLGAPLTGPVYLVSHGAAAFPDVEFLLQGEGVEVVLDGKTDIKHGITYSKFETVPDAPLSSFVTNLPEGPHSVLASPGGNLCGQSLVAPTTLVGQNGAVKTQSTSVGVTGCGMPKVKVAKVKVRPRAVLVTVTTNERASVTVSGGADLKTTRKTLTVGAHRLMIPLTKRGRAARRRHRRLKLKVLARNTLGTARATIAVRL
jgi:hypothetical protein